MPKSFVRTVGVQIVSINEMWVTAGELADSVKPNGELSNRVAEVGIVHLSDFLEKSKKIVFPAFLSNLLLQRKFSHRSVRHHFRRDATYMLSHQNILMFPVLQVLGEAGSKPDEKKIGHWYALSLNLRAKRFELLDSLRDDRDESMVEHATRLMDAIKCAYLWDYSSSKKSIEDYELVLIDVIKQDN